MIKTSFLLLPLLALAGCGVYSERFECDPGKGVGCLALHKVDAQVDQKTLPFQIEETQEKEKCQEKAAQNEGEEFIEKVSPEIQDSSLTPEPLTLTTDLFERKRLPEQSLKVWIAPYEDRQGNFHEASVVHVVVQPGRWSAP